MTFREEIAQVEKGLLLELGKELGATLSYTFANGGDTIDDVVCFPFGTNDQVRVSGASVQDKYSSFVIPVTDTWPGSNTPNPYDVITFGDVVGWVDTCNFDNLNARWKVKVKYREEI